MTDNSVFERGGKTVWDPKVTGLGPSSSSIGEESRGFDKIGNTSRSIVMEPGDMYYAYLDYKNQTLVEVNIDDDPIILPQAASDALEIVPDWIHDDLEYTFSTLSSSDAVTYAQQILDSPEEEYVDEIAFCIAKTHKGLLNSLVHYNYETIFTWNAQMIYSVDSWGLNYTEILEKNDYTTLSYNSRFGGVHELARDDYYWYVVYPRTHIELPRTRVVENNTVFWRSFFLNDSRYGESLYEVVKDADNVYEAAEDLGDWLLGFMEFNYGWNHIDPIDVYLNSQQCSCGQYSIITGTMAKAALIPCYSLGTRSEDHVWNEFYDTRWIMWDTSIGDINTNELNIIDDPGLFDPDPPNGRYGNGALGQKQLSTIYITRGDEYIYQSLAYTDYADLTVTVTDSSGNPIDGARVDLYPATAGSNPDRPVCMWGYTDSSGQTDFKVGNKLDYYAKAHHDVMEKMPDGNLVQKIVNNAQAGQSYSANIQYPEESPKDLPVNDSDTDSSGLAMIETTITISGESQYCVNTENEAWGLGVEYPTQQDEGALSYFVCTFGEFQKYLAGQEFISHQLEDFTTGGSFIFETDILSDLYVVISNEQAYSTAKEVDISIDMFYTDTPVIILDKDLNPGLLSKEDHIHISGNAYSPSDADSLEYRFDNGDWIDITEEIQSRSQGKMSFDAHISLASLDSGDHTFFIRLSSGSNAGTDSFEFQLDVDCPVIDIETPINGTIMEKEETITISGSVSDDIEVSSLIMDISGPGIENDDDYQGLEPMVDILNGTFRYELDMEDMDSGRFTVTLAAADLVGHRGSAFSVFYLDTDSPLVIIDTPQNGDFLGGAYEKINIEGRLLEEIGVVSLNLLIEGSSPVSLLPYLNGSEWSYPWNLSEAESGEYDITVIAEDGIGNTGMALLTVELDITPPQLSINDEDLGGHIVKQGTVKTITGTVSDNLEMDGVYVAVGSEAELLEINFVNDWKIGVISGSIWSYEWDTSGLEGGNYTLIVKAQDILGNNISLNRSYILDAESPILETIWTETNGEDRIVTGNVWINGTASDNLGIAELAFSQDGGKNWISIIGSYDAVSHVWTYKWNTEKLASGTFDIELKAADLARREITVDFSLYVDNYPPEIDVEGGSRPIITEQGGKINIRGTAEDDSGIDNMSYRIDQGHWNKIDVSESSGQWSVIIDTKDLTTGKHTLYFQVEDLVGHSSDSQRIFEIEAGEETSSESGKIAGIDWYIPLIILILVIVTVIIIVIVVVRKKGLGDEDMDPMKDEGEDGIPNQSGGNIVDVPYIEKDTRGEETDPLSTGEENAQRGDGFYDMVPIYQMREVYKDETASEGDDVSAQTWEYNSIETTERDVGLSENDKEGTDVERSSTPPKKELPRLPPASLKPVPKNRRLPPPPPK